jgi:hypothetical protein
MDTLEEKLGKASLEEIAVVRRLRTFCERNNIKTSGAIAFTIQRNRTGEYASLIVDFECGRMHNVYPKQFNQIYCEGPIAESEDFLYCYHAGLDASPLRAIENETKTIEYCDEDTSLAFAFCCNELTPYKPCPTEYDRAFEKFVSGVGSAEGLLFEVKRQVDNGKLISTAVFELREGIHVQVNPKEPLRKVHSFKNYKCTRHKRFFAVDLCKDSNYGRSKHHLRCLAFGKRNSDLENAFFTHHGVV